VQGGEVCWSKSRFKSRFCMVGAHSIDRILEGVVDLGGNASEWVELFARARGTKGCWVYGASWYVVDDGYFGVALGGFEIFARCVEMIGFCCVVDLVSSR
jgi:hypothetical protein